MKYNDDYEEFEEKYHNQNNDNKRHIRKIRPIPFVNIKKEEKAEVFLYVDTLDLPRIWNPIYRKIEKLPDYDYINSIAYEMLTRTDQYKQIINNIKSSVEDRVKILDKLGVDFYEVRRYNSRINPIIAHLQDFKEYFTQSNYDLTLGNIDNGINKLINFYLAKKQILRRVKYKERLQGLIIDVKYKVDRTLTYDEIILSPSDYYIPSKYDYENPKNKYRLSKIDKNISLIALKDEFLKYIKKDIPNDIKGRIELTYTRPLLRFKESAIVDIPINLNLSKKAILQLVSTLKDEFDNNVIKTPADVLYNTNYKTRDWRKDVPFKVTKKAIAKAFFTYDLYKGIDTAFKLKKNLLQKSKEKQINKISTKYTQEIEKEQNDTYDLIQRLSSNIKNKAKAIKSIKHDLKRKINNIKEKRDIEIKQIAEQIKNQKSDYITEDTLINLLQGHKISAYMCKQYLKFMKKYIEHYKYKELIIGVESTI